MRKFILRQGVLCLCVSMLLSCKQAPDRNAAIANAQAECWSVSMGESIMKDFPEMWRMEEADRIKWTYTKGLLCDAYLALWERAGHQEFFNYAQAYADTMINDQGEIYRYKLEDYNIDNVNPGKMLFTLFEETGDTRYEIAIHTLRKQLEDHPRTEEGGFWHKNRYPHQMWLDGLYMGSVFYARYGATYDEPESVLDAANWIILMEEKARDPESGLLYHAWDESREQAWANKETGLSEHFWSRGMGWYAMALVDILDYLNENSRKDEVIAIVNRTAEAIIKVQDDSTGVWFQVLNQGDREGNYLEGSGSAMFTYFLLKALKKGYIDDTYLPYAKKAYNGMIDHLIKIREDGGVVITPVCAGAGLGGDPYRDGTYEYYINEDLRDNDPKAVGPFIMASLLYEELEASNFSAHAQLSQKRVNILFAISDDQSFAHTGFGGCEFVNTPAFDRIAEEGVYFTNCYAGSPGCAPSRSALITGRHHWQNEQAGQHASSWMKKYVPFIDMLDLNGYKTGRTGKGVSPFQYARDENDSVWRETDAGGIAHSSITYKKGSPEDERPAKGIATFNYFEDFKYFMENVRDDAPFFFWYGGKEPHLSYEEGSWKRNGKHLEDAEVPGFLPDNPIIRGDLLDYAVEIDWFDLHLQRMLDYLEEIGELENTIVIVTSDNGMPFPRAKANSYEYGAHVPLAIRYPKDFPGGRIVEDPISFADFAPTILELTQSSSEGMLPMSGSSFTHILRSGEEGVVDDQKEYVFAGRERHSCSRYLNWGYPQRVIRSKDYLLIWNMKPDRWPSGAPQQFDHEDPGKLLPMFGIGEDGHYTEGWAYTDIGETPSKAYIIEHMNDPEVKAYADMALARRPEFELYDVRKDGSCVNNLYGIKKYRHIQKKMKNALLAELNRSGDPRITGPDKEIFDSYLRYSPMRYFPEPVSEN